MGVQVKTRNELQSKNTTTVVKADYRKNNTINQKTSAAVMENYNDRRIGSSIEA
jgi:hypothetical protein